MGEEEIGVGQVQTRVSEGHSTARDSGDDLSNEQPQNKRRKGITGGDGAILRRVKKNREEEGKQRLWREWDTNVNSRPNGSAVPPEVGERESQPQVSKDETPTFEEFYKKYRGVPVKQVKVLYDKKYGSEG